MTHELKITSQYYDASASGAKNFEVRKNDRNYHVGDVLHLRECNGPNIYTGREHYAKITYILDDSTYLADGYVVLGLTPCVVVETSASEFTNFGNGTMIGHIGTLNM